VSRVLPDCPYDVQSEATIIPAAFAPMVTSYICDGPQLSQPVWSQRIHCSRTGLPIVAEITAASSEACGLWPAPYEPEPSYQISRTWFCGMLIGFGSAARIVLIGVVDPPPAPMPEAGFVPCAQK
jgi:hypothetical protein